MSAQDRTLTRLAISTRTSAAEPARAVSPLDFLRLYDAYYSRVASYIHYRCADLHITEDLTAQTFERALDRLHQYRSDRAPFGAWLFAIARNLVNDYLQTCYRSTCLPLEDINDRPADDPSPEERLIETELKGDLLQALQALGERERDILSLKFGARLTNRRIAALTGLSDANVGVIVYRAIHKLRLTLDGVQTGNEDA